MEVPETTRLCRVGGEELPAGPEPRTSQTSHCFLDAFSVVCLSFWVNQKTAGALLLPIQSV